MTTLPAPPCAAPSPARIYNYLLGGREYFPVDRAAAERALSAVPHGRGIAAANRRFAARAARYMAAHGIAQFIDLGAGLLTRPALHHVARSVIPGARVLYVDNDPTVTAHNRRLLTGTPGVAAIRGDLREPRDVLASPQRGELIDLGQPTGLLLTAVLHFVPSEDDPEGAVRSLAGRLVPGSAIAVSHLDRDGTQTEVITAVEHAFGPATAQAVFRTCDQIRGFFAGLDLVPPGLTNVTSWPGRIPAPVQSPALQMLAGVARLLHPDPG
jgi:O-methyltransferase involved in polyketide biosynthesis